MKTHHIALFFSALSVLLGLTSVIWMSSPAMKASANPANTEPPKGIFLNPFDRNTEISFKWAHLPEEADASVYAANRQRIESTVKAAIKRVQSDYHGIQEFGPKPLSTMYGPLVDTLTSATHVASVRRIVVEDEVATTASGSGLYECRRVTLQLVVEPVRKKRGGYAKVYQQSFEDFRCVDEKRMARAIEYAIGLIPDSNIPTIIGQLMSAH